MNTMFLISIPQLTIFLCLFYIVRGESIFGSRCHEEREEECINLGSEDESIGKYFAEDSSFITFRSLGGDSVKTVSKRANIKGTSHSRAFSVQRTHPRSVGFVVGVDSDRYYDVSVGLAELRHCKKGINSGSVKIQGETVFQGAVFDKAGCARSFFVERKNVEPDAWGKIEIIVNAERLAAVSTVCFTKAGGPVSIPPTPSPCAQAKCINAVGTIDYSHVHGSMQFNDASQCKSTERSSAKLQMPPDVKISQALLRWSVYGDPGHTGYSNYERMFETENTTSTGYIVLNDKKFFATDSTGELHTSFLSIFSESTFVTDLVTSVRSGTYEISEVYIPSYPTMCARVQYVSWSLVVVYERSDLPEAFVNVCGEEAKLKTFSIRCLHPEFGATNSRIDMVFNGGLKTKSDLIRINGRTVGKNVLVGRLGNSLDVVSYNIDRFLTAGSESLHIDTKKSKDVAALTIAMTYQEK